jgi:hypothetical protein
VIGCITKYRGREKIFKINLKSKILGLAGKAIFILMKQVAACMPAIQSPGWIVSHHPVFDDQCGYRCLGVSREQDVMPQAKTHNEVMTTGGAGGLITP